MSFGVNNFLEDREQVAEVVNANYFEFPELVINFPVVKNIGDIEDAKLIFRIAMTQFKKAEEYFEVGTQEHTDVRLGQASLYKEL